MKIIQNGIERNGTDGKILVLPNKKMVATCTCLNEADISVTWASFVEEHNGIYYLSSNDNNELNLILQQYFDGNFDGEEYNADHLVISDNKNAEIMMMNDELDNVGNEIIKPNVFAVFEYDDNNYLYLKVYKYDSMESKTLSFPGETKKEFKFFKNIRLCKVLNEEILHYPSIDYFFKMIASLQAPLEVEINGYSEKEPYNFEKFSVPLEYILINYRLQEVFVNDENKEYHNCLADDIILYDNGYCLIRYPEKSNFLNFNDYVEAVDNMSSLENFYK